MVESSGRLRAVHVDFDIGPVVRNVTELPFDRLRVVRRVADLRLASIRAGVLFVFAAWSGPAHVALRRVTRALSSLDLGSLEVVVLDNDGTTSEDMVRLFGHALSGAGETLWIRDGRIVAEEAACRPGSEALIIAHTNELSRSARVTN